MIWVHANLPIRCEIPENGHAHFVGNGTCILIKTVHSEMFELLSVKGTQIIIVQKI